MEKELHTIKSEAGQQRGGVEMEDFKCYQTCAFGDGNYCNALMKHCGKRLPVKLKPDEVMFCGEVWEIEEKSGKTSLLGSKKGEYAMIPTRLIEAAANGEDQHGD